MTIDLQWVIFYFVEDVDLQVSLRISLGVLTENQKDDWQFQYTPRQGAE